MLAASWPSYHAEVLQKKAPKSRAWSFSQDNAVFCWNDLLFWMEQTIEHDGTLHCFKRHSYHSPREDPVPALMSARSRQVISQYHKGIGFSEFLECLKKIMRLKIIEPWFSMIWAYLDRFLQWFVPSTVPFHLIHLLAKTFNTLWQVRPMRWVLFDVSCLRWIGWPVDRGAADLRSQSLSTPVIQTLSKRPNFRGC